MVRSKKAAAPAKDDTEKTTSEPSYSTSRSTIKPSTSYPIQAGGVVKPSAASSSKKRTEKAISQFLSDMLPALKKEMVKRKKEPFSWEPYQAFFKADSGYIQTFILPLFKFLEKDEIICSRYGHFDNKHMVKTTAGFERVMLLSRHCDTDELPGDVQQYLSTRFGKEWFKIPAKDGFRAKAAAAAGHEGCFKVVLTGLFEDSFQDVKTGETVFTINPSLSYEPCRPPPPKKEKAKKQKTCDKKAEKEEEEEEGEDGEKKRANSETEEYVRTGIDVGAQEVPIELVESEGD